MATKGDVKDPPTELEATTQKLKRASTIALQAKLEKTGYTSTDMKGWTSEQMIEVILKLKGLIPGETPQRSGVATPVAETSAIALQLQLFERQEKSRREEADRQEKIRKEELANQEKIRKEELAEKEKIRLEQEKIRLDQERLRKEQVERQERLHREELLEKERAREEKERIRKEEAIERETIRREAAELKERIRREEAEAKEVIRKEEAAAREAIRLEEKAADRERERLAAERETVIRQEAKAEALRVCQLKEDADQRRHDEFKRIKEREIRDRATLENSLDKVISRFGGALKHVLTKMPESDQELPVYLDVCHNMFETHNVPERARAALMMPYLTDRANRLICKSGEDARNTWATFKQVLLREFKMTPRQYRTLFDNSVRKNNESWNQIM